jgi:osmotically-inducible protein OsmY
LELSAFWQWLSLERRSPDRRGRAAPPTRRSETGAPNCATASLFSKNALLPFTHDNSPILPDCAWQFLNEVQGKGESIKTMKTPFILTVAAAAILAVGCDQQKQALNDRSIDSERSNIKKTAREAKSEVDKQAQAQKDMLDAEAKSAQAKLDAEKARTKAESIPDPQPKVDAAAQNIRDAAGAIGARIQTETGAARNPATPTPTTTTAPSTVNESDQKLADQVRTAVFGGAAEANADAGKTIQVSASGSTVTLKGSVKSEEEKTRVETAAKAVAGVSKVENQLEIKAE